ncbi:mucin-2 [Chelonoidis abingdonii]|uniref:mucin-2 n=1 Tax=Chelonoidis abingdonii TaxID=106734 RepID=UPI003F498D1E
MGLRLASFFALWLALSCANEIKKGRTQNHGHYVCSTWGNNHFKSFDGDFYQFPGLCDYNFASDCRESYQEFSVHIQRAMNENGHPDIQYVLITIKDVVIYLTQNAVVVDEQIVTTPYYSSGLLIENSEIYTKVYARAGLVLMWNRENSLMLELDSKFNNNTCGLCGDYNGQQVYNEFISNDMIFNPITFGNMQKINKPNTICEDPDETQIVATCNQHRDECLSLLTSSVFADCESRLNLEMYVQACMQDKCACQGAEDSFCLCNTISEYSRQCSHAGGRPGNWRTEKFCPKTCPGNMIYQESSSPCISTCSHLEISSLCEEHFMDGCFCPEGTVYDDVSGKGCVSVNQCHCKLHGSLYSPGQNITNECEECTCDSGRWVCKQLSCPGSCLVEGGAHITTFDGKKYTFHGDCYYVLSKGGINDTHALLAELSPCGSTDKQTCLKTVVLLIDHKKNILVFRSDGTVLLNELEVHLPHVTASFSIFQPTSYHIIVRTYFGLKLQIQLVPIMQLFVVVDQSAQGKLQGLCGNFNGIEYDDFKTAGGLVEATGSAFANTWKAQATCKDQVDNLEDPCALSFESENYAEYWCSLLKNLESPFARCHSAIDPVEYYKRCKYDTCNCKNSEECLCGALSSYARACAFKGIMLGGWRQTVCNKEVSSCSASQVFRYNLTTCQHTCRSLADGEKHCLEGFIPIDGCGCPDNTYMNEKGNCVSISRCTCYYKGSYLEPGDVIVKQEERCVCRNGILHCTPFTHLTWYLFFTECPSPKIHFDCSSVKSWSSQTPLQLSCHTLDTDYFQTECVSGCMCPHGLIDDGRGGCVKEKDCPCIHNKQFYASGQTIKVGCNKCTCRKGRWTCTDNVCYGTCTVYGSGHYISFDGKHYDFDGHCEYVAAQDYCGKDRSGSFSIVTVNVPCGTTGVTCSKAIKIFLGRTELKFEDKQNVEIQRGVGDHIQYRNRTVGLYLVIEASNGVMLIWDKKTTIFIKLTPNYKGKICGLCGNFDDKSNNDFTTRNGLLVTNPLEFGNSWKLSGSCPDVMDEILPCNLKPHRKSWAEKECSIIRSEVFKVCRDKVDPTPFYENCVHDACSCDSGGDCECFCSAVAAYAQECIKAEACVFWRTPDICPIFCDYYNPRNECEWHYEPCGRHIVTCRIINNVSTNFSVPYLEGCYPRCPKEKPIFDEDLKECVTEVECGCYVNGTRYENGSEIPPKDDCLKWTLCIVIFSHSLKSVAPVVHKNNFTMKLFLAVPCTTTPTTTPTATPTPTTTTTTTVPTSTTTTETTTVTTTTSSTSTILGQKVQGDVFTGFICNNKDQVPRGLIPIPVCLSSPCTPLSQYCWWSDWISVTEPKYGPEYGDNETYDKIREWNASAICENPLDISCRALKFPGIPIEDLGQKLTCNVSTGLICNNRDQVPGGMIPMLMCLNYEISVYCCSSVCPPSTPTTTTTETTTTETTPTTTTTVTTTTETTTPTTTTETTTPTTTTETTTTETTTPTTTTTETTTTETTTPTTTTTPCTPLSQYCWWSDWINVNKPKYGPENGDYETYDKIREWNASVICETPLNISCRAQQFPDTPIEDLGQKVTCDVSTGLICNNRDQDLGSLIPICYDYEISVYCCSSFCTTTATTTTTTGTTTSTISDFPTTTTTETTTTETTTPTTTTTTTETTTTETTTPTTTTTETTTTETTTPPTTTTTTETTTTETTTPTTTTTTTETTTTETTTPTTTTTTTETTTTETTTPTTTTTTTETTTTETTTPTTTTTTTETTTTETTTPTTTTTTTETTTTETTTPTTTTTTTETTTTETTTPTTTTTTTETTTTETTTPTTTTTTTETTTTETTTPTTTTTTTETTTTETTTPPTTTTTTETTTTETTTPTTTTTTTETTTTETTTPTTTTTTTETTTTETTTPTTTTTTTETTTTETTTPTTTTTTTETTTTETTTPTTTTTTTETTTTETTTPTTTTTTTETTTTETTTPTTTTTTTETTTTETTTPTTTTTTTETTTTETTTPTTTTTETTTTETTTPTTTTTTTETTTTETTTPTTTTTTTETTTTTTETTTTETTTPTTPGESYWPCNCTELICINNNTWTLVSTVCELPPKPTCVNGLTPVLVQGECCPHWECDCYCTGWGDPHYVTFDGLYYSYQGNCTYVLVEEINKKIDDFGIYIDNYHCIAQDRVSCPRTLIVRYETQEVRIKTIRMIPLKVQVTVNNQEVATPFEKYGVKVFKSGINHVVEISRIGVNVTYNGLAFSIRLSYQRFGNNTQGQCGTCTNNTADDCMLPGGKIIGNCETMADHWVINDPEKPDCYPSPPSTEAPPVTPPPCKPSDLCKLIKEGPFKACHPFVNPDHYYAACVFDSCALPNSKLECASLQNYAALCADQGVCVDWRGHTRDICPLTCPSNKVYKACGPIEEVTCKSSQIAQNQNRHVEGCFCPAGTMLYGDGVDVCVKTCGCVGPDNKPRKFGEIFEFDCQTCICLEGGSGISCVPRKCPEQEDKPSCSDEGFYEVTEVNPDNICCNITSCRCNTSFCTTKPPKCKIGYEPVSDIATGKCCPTYKCVPKEVCVLQNAEYMPGSPVFADKCHDCVCTEKSNSSGLNVISCKHIPCNEACQPGYELKDVKGECCPKCVQTKCVVNKGDSTVLILSPDETENDPKDNCTLYSCVSIKGQLISSTSKITCPSFNEENCQAGTITLLPNGCCKTCIPRESPSPCSVTQIVDYITHKGCRSVDKVYLTQCEGSCGTFSLYSAEANSMEHKCSCCREAATSEKQVLLQCPNGKSVVHKYLHVDRCECLNTECTEPSSSEESKESEEQSSIERVKRAIWKILK